MARTEITTFVAASSRGTPSYTPIAAFVDGHSFVNNGKRFLLLENSDVGTRIVTAQTPGSVDVNLPIPDRTITVPATTGRGVLGPFGSEYTQPDGKVYIDYSAVAGLTVTFCELA